MKIRLLMALLALSLIFNIFFIAGAMRQQRPGDPIAAITRVANELSLDEQQAGRLAELRASFREETALVREELHEVHDAIASEMASDSPDGTILRSLMEREASLIAERRQAAQQHFGHFVELLTPEQRHDLGRRMHPDRGRGDRPGDPPHIVQRFDVDGDGVLNDAERGEARRAVETRREQHATWRADMRRQFDENQDGRLDAEEREAMRAWLLEQGITPPDEFREEHRRRRDQRRHGGGPPPRGGPRGPGGLPPGGPPSSPPPGPPPDDA
jgi:Spy/CpxP family protein refolding chaperone